MSFKFEKLKNSHFEKTIISCYGSHRRLSLGIKSVITAGCIWLVTSILISFFVAVTMGGRGAEIIFIFSILPGLVGWVVHIGYIKLANKLSGFPTTQPLIVGIITLVIVSLVATVIGKPSPFYAAAVMIFMFGSIPTLISSYMAHWVLLKISRKVENA